MRARVLAARADWGMRPSASGWQLLARSGCTVLSIEVMWTSGIAFAGHQIVQLQQALEHGQAAVKELRSRNKASGC